MSYHVYFISGRNNKFVYADSEDHDQSPRFAGCESLTNLDLGAKVRGVNSFSGEKQHEFGIIFLKGSVRTPSPPPAYGPMLDRYRRQNAVLHILYR